MGMRPVMEFEDRRVRQGEVDIGRKPRWEVRRKFSVFFFFFFFFFFNSGLVNCAASVFLGGLIVGH